MAVTIIKNATLVGEGRIFTADVVIKDGKIATLAASTDGIGADEIIDASGLYALPGLVDGHVHMMDPGYTEREDFITGSGAAAVGGVTTVIEHHRTIPPVYSIKELEEKIAYLSNRSVVDFALKGGGSPDNASSLKAMWERGVTGFKMFTCQLHGVPAMLPGDLYEIFLEIASFNGTALIHAEDDSLTRKQEEMLHKAGRKDYLSHTQWRSAIAEEVASNAVISLAEETGARVVIAHVSQPKILQRIRAAQKRGVQIFAESCPHYFHLSLADLEKKGPWVKFAPALRSDETRRGMWAALNEGLVHMVNSDHCPFPKEEKAKGEENIWDAPNGIPGVETGLKLMLTGVNQGLVDITKVVEVMSENPAKIWGLYPRKGSLTVGSDADIVLVDMKKKQVLSDDAIVSKCGWTPYAGKEVQGIPVLTLVRGEVVARDGRVVGVPGYGKFIPRIK